MSIFVLPYINAYAQFSCRVGYRNRTKERYRILTALKQISSTAKESCCLDTFKEHAVYTRESKQLDFQKRFEGETTTKKKPEPTTVEHNSITGHNWPHENANKKSNGTGTANKPELFPVTGIEQTYSGALLLASR